MRGQVGFSTIGLVLTVGWVNCFKAGDAGPAPDRRFDRIDAFIVRERQESNIPGISIAIVEGDRIVHARGFGNDGNGNVVTAATPFWIGSNTKSFISLAIMQLIETGRSELDAPVQRYLPAFRVADPAASSRVTIRHLLNQTSGLTRQSGLTPVLEQQIQSVEARGLSSAARRTA